MGKFKSWAVTCNSCNWQWETCSEDDIKELVCQHCGSADCIVENINVLPIKKGGKFITEFAYDPLRDSEWEMQGEFLVSPEKFHDKVRLIRENLTEISKDIAHDELVSHIDKVRVDIKESEEDFD